MCVMKSNLSVEVAYEIVDESSVTADYPMKSQIPVTKVSGEIKSDRRFLLLSIRHRERFSLVGKWALRKNLFF